MSQLQQVFHQPLYQCRRCDGGKGKAAYPCNFDRGRSLFIIRVADTGPGIPQECRTRSLIFFFTTKPAGKGTGLGLSVSQNILKIHGGHIAFECPAEGGTVFTVELPLTYPAFSSEERFLERNLFFIE